MVNVLIPAPDNARADGVAYADAASTCEYELPPDELHLQDDCPVRVVPAEALQALLKLRQSFATYEKRFGQVSSRDRANILALFSLVEEERTWDQTKRQEYVTWTLIKRRAERKEARAKRSPEEAKRMAKILADHDSAHLERRGRLHTITDQLNGCGSLRVWWDKRTDTLSPGVFAGSFVEALHVLLLLNLASSESVAVCAWCNKRFCRTMTTQDFCSLRCGNNARKARQRSREKENSTYGSRKAR
jgi:hypothetical protein